MAVNKQAKRIKFKRWMNKEGYKALKIEGNRSQRRKKVAHEILETTTLFKAERKLSIKKEVRERRRELSEKTKHEQIKKIRVQQRAAKTRRARRARG